MSKSEPVAPPPAKKVALSQSDCSNGKGEDTSDQEHPRNLLPELMRQFYGLGWQYSTSGCMSIKQGDKVYVTPSGVQKERVRPEDIFVQNIHGDIVEHASDPALKPKAGACIHMHSKWACLITILVEGNQFQINRQEMLRALRYDGTDKRHAAADTLTVPIIERDEINSVLESHPTCIGVLARRHGLFVWGSTWQEAKIHAEALNYLFEIACELIRFNKPLVV